MALGIPFELGLIVKLISQLHKTEARIRKRGQRDRSLFDMKGTRRKE